jgi:hypothetical protein
VKEFFVMPIGIIKEFATLRITPSSRMIISVKANHPRPKGPGKKSRAAAAEL